MDFVHLHTHSEYSLLDGSIRISKLCKQVKAWGQKAVAVTDHGNLFGAIEFYTKAKSEGLKAIIGAEIFHEGTLATADYVKKYERTDPAIGAFHLVLLAKDTPGYKRLIKIVSLPYIENLKEIPIATSAHLQIERGDSIFALSSCMQGEFAWLVQQLRDHSGEDKLWLGDAPTTGFDENCGPGAADAYEALNAHVAHMHHCFGAGNYFVELIDNNLPEQKRLLPDLVAVARHFDLPLVATADAHYLDAKSETAHAVLMGIKHEMKYAQIRQRNKHSRFHLLTPEEMNSVYGAWPEALANTLKIADSCNVKFEFGKYFLPQFPTPPGETAADTLKRMAQEGLEKRFVKLQRDYGSRLTEDLKVSYRERLNFELGVINNMGFPGYFLIVQDFINWAKDQGIPVGPGRGSGAGSIVAYALRITDLDPIPYNLAFERFLNPERISMPDFDVDFCQDRRDEVIKYVTAKYGASNVAQITTFGKMLAKAAVRDVGRVMDISYGKVDRISKMIPAKIEDVKVVTLAEAMKVEPRIKEEAERDDAVATLIGMVGELEGLSRHTSVHAAGIVMSDGPMMNYVPVYRTPEPGLITQYEMKNAEKVGLVKFDFLGLKTLTVIDRAIKLIRSTRQPDFDINEIPLDIKAVYEDISAANTVGVFQLEGTGFMKLLPKLRPSCFEDIVALVALYRPGPLGSGMVDDFIARKHGEQKIEYPHPDLEPILSETYGIMLYQEQVMRVAATLASYSLGEADLLRRAMGKKIAEEMAAQKSRFVEGATKNGLTEKLSSEIFDLMDKFSEYGFNKSHSAAYGLITYQTAYLKVHFPEEYMAAIMTCDLDNTTKITRYLEECKRQKIKVLPPDINKSRLEFSVAGKRTLCFGLAAIKGIGATAVEPLIVERERGGPFKSLTELAKRTNLHRIGKKTLELLNAVGAMSGFGLTRDQLAGMIGDLVKYSETLHEAKSSGQRTLFGDDSHETQEHEDALWEQTRRRNLELPPTAHHWLKQEKKLLGTYVSGHPLDFHREDIRHFARAALDDLESAAGKGTVAIVALFAAFHERITKAGSKMAAIRLEDASTSAEAVMFEKDLPEDYPAAGTPVVVYGSVSKNFDGNGFRLKLERILPLAVVRKDMVTAAVIQIEPHSIKRSGATSARQPIGGTDSRPLQHEELLRESLKSLQASLAGARGHVPLKILLKQERADVVIDTTHIKIDVTDELLQSLAVLPTAKATINYRIRNHDDDGSKHSCPR